MPVCIVWARTMTACGAPCVARSLKGPAGNVDACSSSGEQEGALVLPIEQSMG